MTATTFEKPIVLVPDIVTKTSSRDDLKFHAAAVRQIPLLNEKYGETIITESEHSASSDEESRFLVASPYRDEDHLLDLDTLSRPCEILAKALTVMTNLGSDYAIDPYHQAFNWDEVRQAAQTISRTENYNFPRSEFYVIVFRSRLPFDADRENLGKLDKDAHREAVVSGQLLKYWFGTPHPETGRNLATCVWRHRDDAKKGGAGPGHRRAMQAVQGIYLEWRVERLKLVIDDNAESWKIEQWVD